MAPMSRHELHEARAGAVEPGDGAAEADALPDDEGDVDEGARATRR